MFTSTVLIMFALLFVVACPAVFAADAGAGKESLAASVTKLLKEEDCFKAIEHIQSLGDAPTVARKYSDLIQDLYAKKDVAAMITVGRAGLQYCLTLSQQLSDKDTKKAAWFREIAQVMSFNLAANAWPGWGEEGISLSLSDMAFGFDMARLDLRLVQELKFPPLKHSNAYWMLAVHYLAGGKHQEALGFLEKARRAAEEANNADQINMVKGYVGITEILSGKPEGKAHFEEAHERLKQSKGEDGKFFADQIQSVLKVLTKK